jgi:uracil-DNA glycosylase
VWPGAPGIKDNRKKTTCPAVLSATTAPKQTVPMVGTIPGQIRNMDLFAHAAQNLSQTQDLEKTTMTKQALSPEELSTKTSTRMKTWGQLTFWGSPEWQKIRKTISTGEILPAPHLVLRPFVETPLAKTRVVLLGSEPYCFTGTAAPDGLAYSTSAPIRTRHDLPTLLHTIYEGIKDNYTKTPEPSGGSLRNWAKQGVLLLNANLTVKRGFPWSHHGLWHPLIKEVLEATYAHDPRTIYIIWAKDHEVYRQILPKDAIVFGCGSGPGYETAARFFLDNVFGKVNNVLKSNKQHPINWAIS